MKPTRPTIRDVARIAGVAPMTVSRVLTGSAKVNASTSEKVRNAISLLRYEPNELAREFRSRPAKGFGLGLPRLGDTAAMRYADAVERLAAAQQLPLTLFSFHEVVRQHGSVVSRAAQRGLQRFILIPEAVKISSLPTRDLESIRVVVLGGTFPGIPVDSVTPQDRQGSRLAVRHLLEHGVKQVAFFHRKEEAGDVREKLEGYRDAISFAEMESIELALSDPADLRAVLLELGKGSTTPIGLVAATFDCTLFLIRVLGQVPPLLRRRIRFISLEDFPTADLLTPSVTAVRQPVEEMSALAVDLLMNGIPGEARTTGTIISVPVELVIRMSCGCDIR